ncbi:MAG: M48 family metallopeptidase [Patescibacteria group bacterium]|nr:M48 family metallopeptidase [Patescibacteria group bacterium]
MAIVYKEITSNKLKSIVLLLVFVAFLMLVGFVFGEAVVGRGGGFGGLTIAGIIAVIYGLIGYFVGGKIALAVSGAKEVTRKNVPQIYNMVENLCITAGLPNPKIYIIDSQAMNAFATGRDPKHSAVALTRGIIEKLDKRELQGVIAHELSHIGNYDIRLSMLVVALVGAVAILSDVFLRFTIFGRGGGKKDGKVQLIMILLAIALAIIAPLIAILIQLAISRKREYLADASGTLLTRDPNALADALEKISGHSELPKATKGTAHLYISNPLKKGAVAKWFSTHPPAEERIKVLRGMV